MLDAVADPEFLARASALGDTLRSRLEQIAARHPAIGEVRGLGPMLAFELAEQAPEQAAAIVAAAFERGLLLLACGLYGNVIRLLAPLTIEEDVLDEGLSVLEDALAVALLRLPTSGSPACGRRYGDVVAVDSVDLDIARGEFFTMLGPSGSGKTTTLRMIAGFEQPDAGHGRARRARTSRGCRRTTATSTRSSRTTRCSRT